MLWVIGFFILFVALMIPILAIVLDSPAVRGFLEARRASAPPEWQALTDRIALLEEQVDDLGRSVESLKEETQFLQRLLETPDRSSPARPVPPRS